MQQPGLDQAIRRRMQANKSRDTKPELAIRRELHRRGLRYFVDRAPVSGVHRRADLVFARVKVAVFVDGCFWHGCPQHHTVSKTNTAFWQDKIQANQARDADTTATLVEAGWTVLRFWEHENVNQACDAVEAIVRKSGLPTLVQSASSPSALNRHSSSGRQADWTNGQTGPSELPLALRPRSHVSLG